MNPSEEIFASSQLPKPEESHPPPPRIPTKKPHFRSADYNRSTRAQQLRVKLWKLHTCNFVNGYQQKLQKMKGNSSINRFRRLSNEFQDTVKHPTLKKCLKYVKKIKFCPTDFHSTHRFFLQLCRPTKLDSLSTSIIQKKKFFNMLKALMNSKLKYCFLTDPSKADLEYFVPKSISTFRRLNKCKLFVQREESKIKILLNTHKLRPFSESFFQSGSKPESLYISDRAIFSPLDSFERISNECWDHEYTPNLPPLPNLKMLDFAWQGLVEGHKKKIPLDLSFVQQYPKLESFKVQIMNGEIETLDFLADLPNLKTFSFLMRGSELKNGLPNLSNLEKFSFTKQDESTIFKFDDLRDFIQKNTNLKTLDLNLPIQDFQGFILPSLEELRLNFLQSLVQPPEIQSASQIGQMLKTHNSIKGLSLEFQQNTSEWNSILLKEGLAEMKSLENLILKFHTSSTVGEIPHPIQFEQFPDILKNLSHLTGIELDLGAKSIDSTELCFILDGLGQLKNLKRFSLTAVSTNLTPLAFDKLLSFLISIRHVKSFHLCIKGINQEEAKTLRNNLLPKFALSQDPFSFL